MARNKLTTQLLTAALLYIQHICFLLQEIPCADEELSTGDGFIQAHPGEESCVDFNIKQMVSYSQLQPV